MSDSNRLESGRYTIASDQASEELLGAVEKTLAQSAARGFPTPGGDTLTGVLGTVQKFKGTLVEANAKIYDERSGQIFQVEEFAMQVLVKLAKYALELYREKLINAIVLEQTEWDAVRDRAKADIARRNVEIEARQVAILRDRAEMERRILVYKRQLVDAETVTLGFETALIQAQLSTAQKKLEIIDSLYQVLAAEQLVLAAEQRKAASLQLVLAAEQIVAEIKKEMVPFIIQKAQAREQLAAATIAEIPTLKAIEELGYDRIALKDAEEAERHVMRQKEFAMAILNESLTRAVSAHQISKAQARRLLLEYSIEVKKAVMDQQKDLKEDEETFRLASGLARQAVEVEDQIELMDAEKEITLDELSSVLHYMELRARDQANTVLASRLRNLKNVTTHLFSRDIREGFIFG